MSKQNPHCISKDLMQYMPINEPELPGSHILCWFLYAWFMCSALIWFGSHIVYKVKKGISADIWYQMKSAWVLDGLKNIHTCLNIHTHTHNHTTTKMKSFILTALMFTLPVALHSFLQIRGSIYSICCVFSLKKDIILSDWKIF